MKTIQQIESGANFRAISVGKLSELGAYELTLAPGVTIQGKVFCGQSLGTTGAEFSFQVFQPGQESGFLHTHKCHEELYFFLSGSGKFQVDGDIFSIGEGSVVRVSPKGRRSVRNNGNEPLVMLCVQYRGDAFTADDATDGVILSDAVEW